ncbi:lactose permease [Pochonia chlamydosporia 170]|uniref:Lactose permease n=1 Tax=Pochonia chlamydosporia 170 TaxID=1380566 RepID=A0A179FS85_METCM|nr:lactose permease [Pochonia chlamydosporia 170]OAQ68485.1 lactose permease [Pochonia chlamydosporia 170]
MSALASEKAGVDQIEIPLDNGSDDTKVKQVKGVQGSERWANASLEAPPKFISKNILFVYVMCIAPFLCGTMSGYDSSIMSSFLVEDSFQKLFGAGVNGFQAGYITAIYQIAGVVAIPFIGPSMDMYGRRLAMFVGSFLSVVGAVIQGTSAQTGSLGQFLAGRALLGFGAVIAQAAATTYCVEIAHPAHRGLLAGGQYSMLNFGGLLAAGVTLGTVNLEGNATWTIPTWTQAVCPGIAFLMVYFLPESPRWLYTHNKKKDALEFITKYHGEGDIENPWVKLQLVEFEEQLELDAADKRWYDYRVLFATRARRYRLANSMMMGVWGALSSGGISYFVGAFFNSAGITDPTTVLTYNVWQNFMSTMASFIGSPLSDRLGRRALLLPTLLGMGISWAAMAAGTAMVEQDASNSAAAKAGIAFYFIFSFIYCIGITPLQGVYAVEVFAYEQRAKGVAFQNLGVNAVGLINQFATPVALERIGYKTYIIFCVWNFVEFAISYFWSVETKGYTLEELDDIFESPNPRKASTKKRAIVAGGINQVLATEKEV